MTAAPKILVTDDREGIRLLLAEFLKKDGYEIIEASDGVLALKALQDGPVDLLLLDMKMSGMDGLETLKRVRGLYPEMPVLVMTAYEETKMINEAERLGANGYISNPFNLEQLKEEVDKYVK